MHSSASKAEVRGCTLLPSDIPSPIFEDLDFSLSFLVISMLSSGLSSSKRKLLLCSRLGNQIIKFLRTVTRVKGSRRWGRPRGSPVTACDFVQRLWGVYSFSETSCALCLFSRHGRLLESNLGMGRVWLPSFFWGKKFFFKFSLLLTTRTVTHGQ